MTNARLQEILNSITIICDTRENENSHVIDYFNKNGVKYVNRALKFGDYSLECEIDGRIVPFEEDIVIERKASLEEISGNLAQNRERFERELEKGRSARFILMVEESAGFEKFIATLLTYGHRYKIDVNFIEKRYAGMFIYGQLFYWLRNYLKGA
jgi:ERCC4-type nuclease